VTSRRGYHAAVIPAEIIGPALSAWPYRVESVAPLAGGWNSATWLVVTAQGRYVAKLVDHPDGFALAIGMRVAEFLAARGLACGAPARTRDGELTISLPEGTLALLRHEPGTPPDLTRPGQVRRAGRVLARAHQALRDFPADSDPRYRWPWEWVPQSLDTIAMPEHVNATARRIWPEIVRTVADQRLSISVIHADPGPDGFLLGGDSTRDGAPDALIDWATTLRGPLLYDLACFTVNTRPAGPQAARWFTEGYAAQMPQIGPQLAHLDCLVKARWLANAIYFSWRIERGITRGPGSPTANQDGLAAAYAGMTAGA
jgi:Ser/Thr protein kinase RdoA (MazF antagonist)